MMMIYEDETFSLERSSECSIPGYLILRLKGPATSLAELKPDQAKTLGEMLAAAARAIEAAVKPERVYVLSFCEVERRLHFHLFPRTAWLLKEYFKANDCANDPVNGPRLFEWARKTFIAGSRLPAGIPDRGTVGGTIGKLLKKEECL
jgi:diadenosine tetraphosphate (Ap4A) HIT family hydrolase